MFYGDLRHEFLVKKFGYGKEFGSRLTAKLLFPQTKLPFNSLTTHNFLYQKLDYEALAYTHTMPYN